MTRRARARLLLRVLLVSTLAARFYRG